MFIKTSKAKGYEYIKLVESYRDKGKTKHRVLHNFGRADLIKKDESFLRIARRLCEIADLLPKAAEGEAVLEGCGEAVLYNYGYLAYQHLWKKLGIEGSLEEAEHDSKITYSLPQTVFLMALQHLLEPMSKLQAYENQKKYYGLSEISLHHLYRALDRLSDQKEEIEKSLFDYNYVRVNKKVDVVFYDVTTIHFESVIADELRDFGFSKNGKFNEVQVVLGMIIDAGGMPVGYELFKGNTFDGKTLVSALEDISKRFGINRVIIVADRGINSKGNLSLIKEAGYGYITAAKIKGAAAALQAKTLDSAGFTDVFDKEGKLEFRYKTFEHTNTFTDEKGEPHELPENMIVTYSPNRARKNKADRDRLVEKARFLLENPEKIKASNKRGGKKFIDQVEKGKPSYALAMKKIEKDAMFDGYYALQTSEKSMSATEVKDAYHTLWKIEESFRIMKTTLELRPVYHSTPKRIEGHFVVCFLAFLMERKMELLLKCGDDDLAASPGKIRKALNSCLLAALNTSESDKFIKTKTLPLANKIFKRLKLNMPNNINTGHDLDSCLLSDNNYAHVQLSLL